MPRTAIINSSWFSLNPAMRWDARYWIHVSEALKEAKVDVETATQEQVRAAILRTEQKISEAQGRVKEKYAQAADLQRQARELAREVDALPTPTARFK